MAETSPRCNIPPSDPPRQHEMQSITKTFYFVSFFVDLFILFLHQQANFRALKMLIRTFRRTPEP